MADRSPLSMADMRQRRRRDATGVRDDAALLTQIVATQGEIADAGLDPKKVVDIVTQRMQQMTRSAGAVVEIADGDVMAYWSGSGSAKPYEGLRIPLDGSLSGLAVRLGLVLRCDDSESDPRVNRDACRKVGLRSAIVVPLQCTGRPVGVLKVISPQVAAYTQRDVALLEMFATFVGNSLHYALEHARLRERIDASDHAVALANLEREARRDRIRDLIEHDAFESVFQPIVDLKTREVVGVEGLTRFAATPDDADWFVEAGIAGLTPQIELACMRKILRRLPRIPAETYLSFNISPATAVLPEFAAALAHEPCDRLVVELTEHAEVRDYAELVERIAALRRRGVRIAIDDAGAGFASLRHVLRLSPDIIKMDVSLTHDIDTIDRKRQLGAAIAMFCRESGAKLVAEGVETHGELETLIALGVPYGQGFLLGRPAARAE